MWLSEIHFKISDLKVNLDDCYIKSEYSLDRYNSSNINNK
jgi:hypothetical protein